MQLYVLMLLCRSCCYFLYMRVGPAPLEEKVSLCGHALYFTLGGSQIICREIKQPSAAWDVDNVSYWQRMCLKSWNNLLNLGLSIVIKIILSRVNFLWPGCGSLVTVKLNIELSLCRPVICEHFLHIYIFHSSLLLFGLLSIKC